MTEEEKRALENAAMVEYGKSWEQLTEEEKQALYYDYEGRRATLGDEYVRANQRANQEVPQGIQAGNVYVASNPLAHIGHLMDKYKGNKRMDEITQERDRISGMYGTGAQAGGALSANAMANAIRQQPAPNAAAPAPQAPAQPPQSAPAVPLQPNQVPMRSAGNPMPPLRSAGNASKIPGNEEEWWSYFLRSPVGGR